MAAGFHIRMSICILALLSATALRAWAEEAAAPNSDGMVARVGGVAISNSEVEEAIDRHFIPAGGFHGGVSIEKRKEFRPQAIDLLIEKELLYQEAKNKGYKASETEIDGVVSSNVKRFGSRDALERQLKLHGISDERFRTLIEKEILITKIVAEEITKKSRLSDDELKEYYQKHIHNFKRPETMRVWHILVSVSPTATGEQKAARKARAEEVHGKAKKGDDFVLLAEQYSDDPYRVKGGDLGYIHKGRLDAELETVVFELKEGELSPVVETIHGFHIMRAGDRKMPETIPFEEAKNKLKSELEAKRSNENRKNLITSLKVRIVVEVF